MRSLLLASVAALAAAGVAVASGSGSVERGKAVYTASNCFVCHAFAPSGQQPGDPTIGPDLAAATTADAQEAGVPLEPFTLQALVDPDAAPAAGYPGRVMKSYAGVFTMQQLDDLVSFLVGKPYASGIATESRRPGATCSRSRPCSATVAGWAKRQRLPARALPGARIFAATGCLACHRYAGSGPTYTRAPDLTAEGRKHRGVPRQIARLRCPSCVSPSSRMPRFANLDAAALRQLAIFLEASGRS